MPERGGIDAESRARRDGEARERALDIGRSFLVQAPAGSGKTGLLIQRFLALLAHVDRPERIVAMTFTRKAATEMRERVLKALRDAETGVAVDAARSHDVVTRRLALGVLEQDRARGWQLTTQPSRLRMMTIDALSTALARQAPVATGLGALPAFVDDARPLYAAAARDALAAAGPEDPAWGRFLAHLDNNADTATRLLASLLGKRDQWLRLPVGGGAVDLRAALEGTLRSEIEAALVRLQAIMPDALVARLPALQRYAAGQLDGALHAGLLGGLQVLAAQGGVPPTIANAVDDWRVLADWLLARGEPRFRASVNKGQGFPAKGNGEGAADRGRRKADFEEWLADASDIPGMAAALHAARGLPPPRYTDGAWSFVEATLDLLQRVAAHLLAVFAREGVADFAEATLRALAALGEADDPGDLLLALDFRIAHLLVDEFQDTSWAQLQLIARLTSGWEDGDGRTLFAVGDPMQSVYRFREAEVGIFVAAQAQGTIGDIAVECLELARNFRSQRPIVHWINQVFPRVLPDADDAARGEVAYKPALATRGEPGDWAPTLDLVADSAEEADAVVRRTLDALEEGAREVAVLVRARTHLDSILPALRRAGIPFAAIDLESLSERLATRDLASLTRALIQPADRLAALAVLRAPWCGLVLADLLVLAQATAGVSTGVSTGASILTLAADPLVMAALSADGRARFARFANTLAAADASRGRAPLVQRVRGAWLALGGPACGEGDLDLAGAERYFALLAAHQRAGDLPDWDAFIEAAARLYAEPGEGARVQVMTLHKAKGLEFDTVILPGLARTTGRGDDDALRWKMREGDGEKSLMLAPLRAREGAHSEHDRVYQYLKALAAGEDAAELGRLLYVGCTRAMRRLHLVAAPKIGSTRTGDPAQWATPPKGSALAGFWPALAHEVPPPSKVTVGADDDEELAGVPDAPPLLRLPAGWRPPAARPPIPGMNAAHDPAASRPAFDWAHATAAAVGSVAHRIFAQIGSDGLATWGERHVAAQAARIRVELAAEGVDSGEVHAAAAQVDAALRGLLGSDKGRWLFDDGHAEAASERALAGIENGRVVHVVLDRTFVAGGVRWIVDFKTGTHEGADVDGFLASEVERYRAQLERYARFVALLERRPVRLGLFYPRLGAWREWAWVPQTAARETEAGAGSTKIG